MELLEELNLFWTTIMYDDPQPSWKQRQSLIVIMIGGKVADMILKTNLKHLMAIFPNSFKIVTLKILTNHLMI